MLDFNIHDKIGSNLWCKYKETSITCVKRESNIYPSINDGNWQFLS